jgi:hypothetical protein
VQADLSKKSSLFLFVTGRSTRSSVSLLSQGSRDSNGPVMLWVSLVQLCRRSPKLPVLLLLCVKTGFSESHVGLKRWKSDQSIPTHTARAVSFLFDSPISTTTYNSHFCVYVKAASKIPARLRNELLFPLAAFFHLRGRPRASRFPLSNSVQSS